MRSILVVARVCHCSPPLPARPSLAWRQDAAPLAGPARVGWKEDGQLDEPARRSMWHTAGESGGKVEVVLRLPDGGGVFGVDELSNVGDTLLRPTRRSCSVYRVQAIQIGQRVDKFQRSTKEHVSAYVLSPVICDECVVRSNLQGPRWIVWCVVICRVVCVICDL